MIKSKETSDAPAPAPSDAGITPASPQPPPAATPTPSAKSQTLEERMAALQAENDALKGVQTAAKADEEIIATKMMLGLSRPQAVAVIHRQRNHDKDPRVIEFRKTKAIKAAAPKT